MISPVPSLSQESKEELRKIHDHSYKKDSTLILNFEEGKHILFSILEKHYSEEELSLYKELDSAIIGTPHFTYLSLLDKWFICNQNVSFKRKKMKEKYEFFIRNRGAGNSSAYSKDEISLLLTKKIKDYRDIIINIIDYEFSNEDSNLSTSNYLQDTRPKFIKMIIEIEVAYFDYRKKTEEKTQ